MCSQGRGTPLAQIEKDFGLSVTTLKRWIAIAERKETGAARQQQTLPKYVN